VVVAATSTSSASVAVGALLLLLLVVSGSTATAAGSSSAGGSSAAALPLLDDLVAVAGEAAGDDDLRLLRVATMVGADFFVEWGVYDSGALRRTSRRLPTSYYYVGVDTHHQSVGCRYVGAGAGAPSTYSGRTQSGGTVWPCHHELEPTEIVHVEEES